MPHDQRGRASVGQQTKGPHKRARIPAIVSVRLTSSREEPGITDAQRPQRRASCSDGACGPCGSSGRGGLVVVEVWQRLRGGGARGCRDAKSGPLSLATKSADSTNHLINDTGVWILIGGESDAPLLASRTRLGRSVDSFAAREPTDMLVFAANKPQLNRQR